MPADVESALEAWGDLPPHVVDGLPMPVVLTRRADDVVVRVNREYTATYGLSDEDAAARPFRELHWVQEDRDHTLELQASGNLESIEVRIRTADGGMPLGTSRRLPLRVPRRGRIHDHAL